MKLISKVLIIITALSMLFAGELKVGSGAAATEGILKPIKEAFEKATGVKLTVISSGPKIAWLDLDKGSIDVAIGGMGITDWEKLMKTEGVEIKDPKAFTSEVIGKDSIKVLLNLENPVKELSKSQLKGIFTGTITNWSELGWKDLPVIVVWGKLISGTNSMFQKNIMDGDKFLKDVLDVNTADDIKQNVAGSPEAIGFGPNSVIDNTVFSPTTPELSRPVTYLTKGKPSADAQKLLDFIKGPGKKYIKL